MRISEVCGKVGLTERAVRLYIREGLVQPGQRNGITVFNADGAARLEQIAAMRRADFSIEQIRRMLNCQNDVGAVIEEKKAQLKQRVDESQILLSALEDISSVEQLVQAIRSAESPQSGPIRTSFDEPLPSEADIRQAWEQVNAAERRKTWRRKLIPVYIAAALAVVLIMFSFINRLDEYAEQNSAAFENLKHLQPILREILDQRDKGVVLPEP